MDKETLYNAEVKFLINYCRNCLDSSTKDKLAMFLFKMTLLENAEELGLPKDVEMYYHDILNLLGINPCLVCDKDCSAKPCNKACASLYNINCPTCSVTNNCNTCPNGYCSICK